MTAHVVVVGGGIAGLVAADALVSHGCSVTVVEAGDRLGGKLLTTPFAGRVVDEGADAFLLRVPWAYELCASLGLAEQLVNPSARNAYVWSHGELRPLPAQHMGVPTDLDELAASGLVSEAGLARARRDLTDPANPLGTGDQTIASVVESRLGREVLERLVDPLVGGINAGDTRELSLDAVVPQIAAAARDRSHASLIEACRAQQAKARAAAGADADRPIFASPSDGMEAIVHALAARLERSGRASFGLGRSATGLEPQADGSWVVVLDGGSTIAGDGLILALPAFASARLLAGHAPTAAAALAGIDYASVAIVTFAFGPDDVGRPLDRSGFLVPRVEPTRALSACSWASTKWAYLAPERGDGTVIVRASSGRSGNQEPLDLSDGDLVAQLLDDLGQTMAVSGAPSAVRVSRWNDSFPQYAPGHLERIAAIEAALPPRLALAGAALRGVGVPACIRSGTLAATQIGSALRT